MNKIYNLIGEDCYCDPLIELNLTEEQLLEIILKDLVDDIGLEFPDVFEIKDFDKDYNLKSSIVITNEKLELLLRGFLENSLQFCAIYKIIDNQLVMIDTFELNVLESAKEILKNSEDFIWKLEN